MAKLVSNPHSPTLEELNRKLNQLSAKFEKSQRAAEVSHTWWHDHAGRFEGDAAFAEIVRLGRQQRATLNRAKTKKKRARS